MATFEHNIRGFHRQAPDDGRDFKFKASPRALASLPKSMHLTIHATSKRKLSGPFTNAWNQSSLGSCGLQTLAELFVYDQMAANVTNFVKPSILFMYWWVRYYMGMATGNPNLVNQDTGVNNRIMMQTIAKVGWCPESMMPYDINRFREKPSEACMQAAAVNRLTEYRAVQQTQDDIKACIAGGPDMQGRPFVLGFMVFPEFQSEQVARTGIVPMPRRGQQPIGGHDVLGVGYDENGVYALNHYGDFGMDGYLYLPWEYVLTQELAGDYWTAYWAGAIAPNFSSFTTEPQFPLAV